MNQKKCILLLSGGLDSITLLYQLIAENCMVHALLFDYGQQHVQELLFAKAHCRRNNVLFTIITLPKLGGLTGETSWIVPNRNAIFIMLAANKAIEAGAESVIIGCNADDEAGFPDCRQSFIQQCNIILQIAKIDVEVCAPFLDWKKWKIARLAQDYGIPSNEIWTCYKGGSYPCGKCPACLKLETALNHK